MEEVFFAKKKLDTVNNNNNEKYIFINPLPIKIKNGKERKKYEINLFKFFELDRASNMKR